jgi:hypothetical protein
MDYYIYIYKHPISGDTIYVGKGINNRAYNMKSHFCNKHLKKIFGSVKNYKPFIEIIERNLTEEQSLLKEKTLIKQIGRQCDGGPLVNISPGGKQPPNHKGEKWSKERKQRHSQLLLKHHKSKIFFDKDYFEKLVQSGYSFEKICNEMNLTPIKLYTRFKRTYNTQSFTKIVKKIGRFNKDKFEQLVLDGKRLFEVEKSLGLKRSMLYSSLTSRRLRC